MRAASGISLALQALRIAAAVPALVMAAGDLLGHLHERRLGAGEDARADRRVGLHVRPLGRVELAGLQQDLVGDAHLAHVVQGAGVPQQVGLDDAHPDLAREPLAHLAHSLDVHAGLGVAPFHRDAQAVRDLALRVGEVGRALAHALLEQLVVAADSIAHAPFGELAPGDRAERPDQERHERRRHVEDHAALEGELGAAEEGGAGEHRDAADGPQREPPAGQRGQHGQQDENREVEGRSRRAQREAVERGPDRVRLDLGAGHELLAAYGRRVDVAQGGRRAADHDDPAADLAVRHAVVKDVGEGDRRDRAGRAAVVDPGLAVAEAAGVGRLAGEPLRRGDGDALDAADLIREARDRAARVVAEIGGRGARVDRARGCRRRPRTFVRPL